MRVTQHLYIKIITVLVLTVGVLISISSYYNFDKTRTVVEEQSDIQGEYLSSSLAIFVVEDLLAWDYPALYTAIQRTSESNPQIMAIEVYHHDDTRGDILVANYSSYNRCGGSHTTCRTYTAPVVVKVAGGDRNIGYTKIVLSEERYHTALAEEINSSIVSGLILLITITLLTYLSLNNLILKPLRRIEIGTKIIGRGILEHRIMVKSNDEIGRLADAFNLMTYNLKLSMDEAEDYKRHLEEKVDERTKELREAYEKLKELDVMKSQFFATVSHELRTPLTLILSPLESMKQGDVGTFTPDQIRFIDTIHKNTLILLKLINNLLDFSKIEAGKMRIRFEKQDIVELVKAMFDSAIHTAKRKHIHLELDAKEPIPQIYFDREKVEKIFYNLLSNALKFTPKGGQIVVRVRDRGDAIAVSVSDTGIGIPKKDQKRVFDRFAQVDSSAIRQYGGTGIGLSLAKELVEMHKGRINLESDVGKGSTFTFELLKGTAHIDKESIVEETAEREDEREMAKALSETISDTAMLEFVDILMEDESIIPEKRVAGRSTILVIEDNPDLVKFLAHLLGDTYNVITASNGVIGMDKVNEELPDLVISDIMMPKKDGYQVCKEIKEDERTKHIPVILLTAKADISMKIEGLKYGADDYLTKPFNSKELLVRVNSLLNLRQMEGEVQKRSEKLEELNLQLKVALEDLKETQLQLIQSEKIATIGALAGGVAHEINNPLGAILANTQMLLRDTTDVDSIESLKLIEESSRRCRDIVKNLLTYSRKPKPDEFKPVDLNEVIGNTCNLIRYQIEGDENLVIETEYGDIPDVWGNANELEQVFTNLILNSEDAIKETGKPGKITIKTYREDNFVVSTVTDTGVGIPEENMKKIFNAFFTTKSLVGESGTGLGLSITRKIIEKHKGEVTVSSKEGKGATFTIRLQLSEKKSGATLGSG